MRVVLTRPREKDEELAGLLRKRGFEPVFVPVVAYEKLEEGYGELEEALAEPWDWVVITSPEAARYFLGAWYLAGAPEVRVAAVGESTARVLEGQGLEVAFLPSRAEAAALARELPGTGRVLWPTSARAGDELVKDLARRGIEVRRLNVYTTRRRAPSEEEREAARGAVAVMLGSPSAAEAWASLGLPLLPAAAVGEKTGKRAEELGFSPVVAAREPGLLGWVEALERLAETLGG